MKERITNNPTDQEPKKSGISVERMTNPDNGWEEIILHVATEEAGKYQTEIGVIEIKSVLIWKGETWTPSKKIKNQKDELVKRNGVSGAQGSIYLDLSNTDLTDGSPGALSSIVDLHRKGIGCKQIASDKRVWVDMGKRLAPTTGWEKPIERWVPINRT